MTQPSARRPGTVYAAAALEAAEGLAALGFGLFVGVETAIGKAVDPVTAVAVTVMALVGGAAMLGVARGLLRAEQWSRAPVVVTQLFSLPVAWSLWQSEQPFYAVPLGIAAIGALVTVLAPPTTAWLAQAEADDEDAPAADPEPKSGRSKPRS
ncbi:hypothetical protein [Actinomadura hibisca]|uniref:hypothetical protein n=1 Tax=Actinomadura hibisca TaxID=68565 RepID=UPI00083060A6|nr:hypothetical protein [Actinomadura hibisca]